MKNKIKKLCDYCGAEIELYPSKIKKHTFCSKACLAAFSSKAKNPDAYQTLKDYTGMSQNMSRINVVMNPKRMTMEVRLKIRRTRIARRKGELKSYPKYLGRHLHRIAAEAKLGRSLNKGEVVHHIDGDKQNYAESNLMVFASQAQHAAWHAEHDKKKEGDAK